ncbi:NADAR family protein (plasmid) [Lentzea sp. JNUCC 0626]|uniref:NADAR family protein n=1 Tax=Lentzea sp. JNUCC 0626 TaxID=3367513 RepID=UPI0037489D79
MNAVQSTAVRGLVNGFTGDTRFLSMFSPHPVTWQGQRYPTGEAAFHAGKTDDPQLRAWIAAASTPAEAKRRGRRVPLRAGWDEHHRHVVMQQVIENKFTDPDLAAQLLATGDDLLVERNTWHDDVCARSVSDHGDCKQQLPGLSLHI